MSYVTPHVFNTAFPLTTSTGDELSSNLATTLGLTDLGDGDGGVFCWDPSSLATDDGVDVIQPTSVAGSDPGRWLRVSGTPTGGGTFTGPIEATSATTGVPAIKGTATVGNAQGVLGQGFGTSAGVAGIGGATDAAGLSGTGGATNGNGVFGQGTGSGSGVRGEGGTTGFGVVGISAGAVAAVWGLGTGGNVVGVKGTGANAGNGIEGFGDATGAGLSGTGGATSGAGVSGTGGPASYGGAFTGGTTGAGVLGQGGATNGLGGYFNGGGTNGGGIYVDGRGTGIAITAVARDGYGASIESDATTPAKAALHIEPQDAEPTGPNAVGDIYVTTAGVLKICTVAGTPGTWVSVGAQ
jgi:hypothetical protein